MAENNTKNQSYTAKDIQVLEGLEPVRKRPGMYIGSTGPEGLHHLVKELFDNSLDECLAGYAKSVEVSFLPSNRVRVSDDGRGIPTDIHPKLKKSALELAATVLHAGGKFGGESYKVSGGLHGVGLSVVNALSTWMKIEVHRKPDVFIQEYKIGKPLSPVKRVGKTNKTGTIVTFEPDSSIFETVEFDKNVLINHFRQQAYLTKGINITVRDERNPLVAASDKQKKEYFSDYAFYFEGGIVSFVNYLNRGEEAKHKNIFYAAKQQDNVFVEVAVQYIEELSTRELGFANNIHTTEGGSHITGFRSAITRILNDYARKNGFIKEKEDNLTGEDIREGMTAIISVKIKSEELQFEGQTKGKLGNPEGRTAVETVMNAEFTDWLERNPNDAREILDKVILASKARLAARAARDTVLRKGALEGMTLPGKLADCSSRDASESEIFIVEGDSAGGCWDGNTLIALADGRDISFKQLVRENKLGKQNFCYTIQNNGHIGISPIINPRITKRNVEVIKVILDTGEELICTPDHLFMLRDKSYKKAKNLTSDDSLMPLYKKISKKGEMSNLDGYEMIFDQESGKWMYTHILADIYNLFNNVYKASDGKHRHHVDFNKRNNNPTNIKRLSYEDHMALHYRYIENTLKRPDVIERSIKTRQTKEYRDKVSKLMLKPEMRAMLSTRAKKQWENEEYKKFMTDKFLEFYKTNEEYRNKNNQLLDEVQKIYWSNKDNRKKQAERVAEFFENHPERKEWLSLIAKNQWQDVSLLEWRSEITKRQWTPAFRAKRKESYNRTYLDNSLKLLKRVLERDNSISEYDNERIATKNKNALRFDRLTDRFFNGDSSKVLEAVKNYNHKILKIERLKEKIDVYDIEIPETHNFALASGVFVHNSSKSARDRRTQAILPLRGKILNVEKARLDKMLASQEIRALIIALGTAIAEEFDISKLRYHKIVIMTDADVDGSHIRTLLLTMFYRYFPQVIEQGHLYIAQPPLYKISKGQKSSYAFNDMEKEKILTQLKDAMAEVKSKKAKTKDGNGPSFVETSAGKWEVSSVNGSDTPEAVPVNEEEEKISGVSIQRYKGLGEMNPDQLWETTLDPANRVLLQVMVKDAQAADKVFDVLMGSEVLPRKKFIQTHAKSVQNLDI